MTRTLLFVVLCVVSLSSWAETLLGRVVGIADGDTVTVLDGAHAEHRIRLAGIDAPEKRQAFGERARQHLASLVFSKPVRVEWYKRDRYQRIIGVVWVAPADRTCGKSPCPINVEANLAMVSAGLSWHYKHYEREQSPEDRERYASAEDQAQSKHLGLWRDPAPMAPWEWRAMKRSGAKVAKRAVR